MRVRVLEERERFYWLYIVIVVLTINIKNESIQRRGKMTENKKKCAFKRKLLVQ